jgi:hypothetical protein
VVVSEGVDTLDRAALLKPGRVYTKEARLTIRAEILPDDPDWNPARMPVVISTMPLSKTWMGRPDPFGGVSYGFQIETSHATMRGLRILGNPVHEHPGPRAVRRNDPLVREGRGLDDLLITQCLFLGDEHAAPNHLPVRANGQGIMLDHCVFFGCKQTAVYWFARGGGAGATGCDIAWSTPGCFGRSDRRAHRAGLGLFAATLLSRSSRTLRAGYSQAHSPRTRGVR